MKLSEAIREGIKMDGPQIRGQFFHFGWNMEVLGCCALGAALLGIGKDPKTGACYILETFPTLKTKAFELPQGIFTIDVEKWSKGEGYNCPILLNHVIVYLNDKAEWTREQIADWLESIGE
jgi:hypothetical protein